MLYKSFSHIPFKPSHKLMCINMSINIVYWLQRQLHCHCQINYNCPYFLNLYTLKKTCACICFFNFHLKYLSQFKAFCSGVNDDKCYLYRTLTRFSHEHVVLWHRTFFYVFFEDNSMCGLIHVSVPVLKQHKIITNPSLKCFYSPFRVCF